RRSSRKAAAPRPRARRPSIQGDSVGTITPTATGVLVAVPGTGVSVCVGVLVAVAVVVAVAVLVGVAVGAIPPPKHCEDSDVSNGTATTPRGGGPPPRSPGTTRSVAVAVMTGCPGGIGKLRLNDALPPPSVMPTVDPRNACPSPKLLGGPALQAAFEKNSIR